MRRGWMAATWAALILVLAACGARAGGEVVEAAGDGGAEVHSPTPSERPGASADEAEAGDTPEGSEDAPEPGAGPGSPEEPAACRTVRGGGDHVAQLVDVRVGTHDGYDRIVFELAAVPDGRGFGVPRFEVRPLEAPILDDPRGAVVPLEGSSFAGVVLHGATGVAFTTSSPQGYELTYDGPRRIHAGFPVLLEAVQTGDFEATLSWAFGLSRASCFEVSVLHDPLRIVIDFPTG